MQSNADSRARIALDFIGRLYAIERSVRERKAPLDPAAHLELRRTQSAPILQQLHAWLNTMASEVLPQSALGKAIAYALAQWSELTVFIENPVVPLDNNRCENAIGPFVVGRKNWLFSDTEAGARASANLYSLIETAKASGVKPHAYLTHLYTRLPTATRLEHFEALLPWNAKSAVMPSR